MSSVTSFTSRLAAGFAAVALSMFLITASFAPQSAFAAGIVA